MISSTQLVQWTLSSQQMSQKQNIWFFGESLPSCDQTMKIHRIYRFELEQLHRDERAVSVESDDRVLALRGRVHAAVGLQLEWDELRDQSGASQRLLLDHAAERHHKHRVHCQLSELGR